MHEIVTLQFGNRANYLATHFWNIQESYFTYPTPLDPTPAPSPVDHDIHFRPGIGADGSDTYTPRTLIYDFQANFGGLRKLNALYDTLKPQEPVTGLWDGRQLTQAAPPIQPIQYQINLESGLPTPQLYARDVRYWSDFNHLFYHPRSIQPLSPQSFSSSLNATETWSNGTELYRDLDREVDLLDRDVRPFAEECDSLSAFQIFASVDDSWGGYTSSYVEALREEYGKKGVWVWAIEDGRRIDRTKQYQRLANSAKSLRSISQNASAYTRVTNVPTSLPEYIQLDAESEWSTTALMCAAIETVTLPARLRSNGQTGTTSISTLEDTLNTNGNQNVWTLNVRGRAETNSQRQQANNHTLPSNGNSASQGSDLRLRHSTNNLSDPDDTSLEPSTFDIDFTPTIPTAQSTFPSLIHPRSQTSTHIFSQIESHRFPSASHLPSLTSSSRHHHAPSTPIVSTYACPLPFPLLTSYPSTLFRLPHQNQQLTIDAALSTTSSTKYHVLALRDLVAGSRGRAMALVESDEVEAMYDDLTRVAEAFDWGWERDGESSEDD